MQPQMGRAEHAAFPWLPRTRWAHTRKRLTALPLVANDHMGRRPSGSNSMAPACMAAKASPGSFLTRARPCNTHGNRGRPDQAPVRRWPTLDPATPPYYIGTRYGWTRPRFPPNSVSRGGRKAPPHPISSHLVFPGTLWLWLGGRDRQSPDAPVHLCIPHHVFPASYLRPPPASYSALLIWVPFRSREIPATLLTWPPALSAIIPAQLQKIQIAIHFFFCARALLFRAPVQNHGLANSEPPSTT